MVLVRIGGMLPLPAAHFDAVVHLVSSNIVRTVRNTTPQAPRSDLALTATSVVHFVDGECALDPIVQRLCIM